MRDLNDKFYTKDEIIENYIIPNIDLSNFSIIIEPSAGSGRFLRFFPPASKIIAIDIFPENEYIKKEDFLEYNFNIKDKENTIVIGNPPFGKKGEKALKFIRKSMDIADTVAFILPASFSKDYYLNKIPLTHSLIKEVFLPDNSFTLTDKSQKEIRAVFQVWIKKERKKIEPYTSNFLNISKKYSQESIAIRRVGRNAGISYLVDNKKSEENFYFISIKDNYKKELNLNIILSILMNINFDEEKRKTVNISSISKSEILKKIDKEILKLIIK